MTGKACLFGIRGRAGVLLKVKIGPFVRQRGILHLDPHAHQISLKISVFVDGAFALRRALFDYESCLVRPISRFQKFLICPLRHKDISKHVMIAGCWTVVHTESGREKYPFAIILRAQQFSALVVLRLVGIVTGTCQQNRRKHQNHCE